jgi:hypothetical protein
MPYYKKDYSLMYSPQHFYVFFRFFYTFYERMVKARELIAQKVDEDEQPEEKKELTFNLFLCGIAACLAGTIDAAKFEDF